MANTSKVTFKDYYNAIIELAKANDREDIVAFAEGRIAQIDKKNSNRKPTKTQEENEVLKGVVLSVVTDEPATVSEIMAKDATLGGLSNQKVTALLKALIEDGAVVKTKDGRKTVFTLATEGDEVEADTDTDAEEVEAEEVEEVEAE